jgi:hypothetical protein
MKEKLSSDTTTDVTKSEVVSDENDRRDHGVTPRVVILCLLLAVFFGYAAPVIDYRLSNTYLGATHLPPGAIGVLLLMLMVNPLLTFFSRGSNMAQRLKFRRNELLTIYISCLFSCLVPGIGAENYVVPNLISSFYYATNENGWLEFLRPYLHSWLTPALNADGSPNTELVQNWYVGLSRGESIPWGLWLIPLMAWGIFIFASYCMLGCLAIMLRAQWAENEALSFPLLRLPLEMTQDVDNKGSEGVNFFQNPMMWIGFGVVVLIQALSGLSTYFPDVPMIKLSVWTDPLLTEAPWNQIGWTPLGTWPIAVGVAYLLTSEISFSLWFFYWFIRLQYIAAYYMGLSTLAMPSMIQAMGGGKTFVGFQQAGAYIGYAGIVLWTARLHLRHVMRRAFGRAKAQAGEEKEALPYPLAFWGFVTSLGFLIAWSVAAGIRLDIALVLWASYLVTAIALTRVVVEGGLLFVQVGAPPLGLMAQLFGSGPGQWLAPSSIVPASFIQISMMTDLRAFLMPSFVQGFKLAHERKISARPLLALIFAVILITLSLSMWMNVKLGYENGGLTLANSWFSNSPHKPAYNIRDLIKGADGTSWTNSLWLGVGSVLTLGMMTLRARYVWFPLHPLGYLMCLTYPMNRLWFSIFLGWLCKLLITRFGGGESYRKATPFFLGLILGEVVMALLWLIVDGWQGHIGHQTMPG